MAGPLSFLTEHRQAAKEKYKRGKPKPQVVKTSGFLRKLKEKFAGSLSGKASEFRVIRKPGATPEGIFQQIMRDTGDTLPKARERAVEKGLVKKKNGEYEVVPRP